MKLNELGRTGIFVTELCFGALPIGPLQANVPVQEAARVIREALEGGVNFVDTAQSYRTYPHLREALRGFAGDVVIASKSQSLTYQGMEDAVHEAVRELNRDWLDIFLVHSVDRLDELATRRPALDCLLECKRKGMVKAVGLSTHSVVVASQACKMPEIEVLLVLVNKSGIGLRDGTVGQMTEVIGEASRLGKGVYVMKALGGGQLIGQFEEAVQFVRAIPGVQSIALGCINSTEVQEALQLFTEGPSRKGSRPRALGKRLFIASFCKGCGHCTKVCPAGALSVVEGKAVVDQDKCLLCGYCNAACPEFAIRVV
ncbi:MAG: aldo/keto reductase [Bacillota bacterium]